MNFISLDEVLIIHDLMLQIGGGREGVHDFTLLHSAVERPKAQFGGIYLYNSIWQMAAALLQSLVKNHPFDDGNKRTAYFSVLRFLNKNGYTETSEKSVIITFMVEVDIKNKTVEEIAEWLEKNSRKK